MAWKMALIRITIESGPLETFMWKSPLNATIFCKEASMKIITPMLISDKTRLPCLVLGTLAFDLII